MEENNDYGLSVKLNEYFKDNIKLSFVWEGSYNFGSVIIVTNDDEVYEFQRKGLKAIQYSVIIIGNDNEKIKSIIEEQMVKELCYKQLIDFKNGMDHIIARTCDGKVYCWGRNYDGVLGNGKTDSNVYKPELNQSLSEKQIKDICCGSSHTVVLTNSGEVYSWGNNLLGQIGIGRDGRDGRYVLVPQQLNGFNGEKVKAISCGESHSLALTESGRVFSWGSNKYRQLGLLSKSFEYRRIIPFLIGMNRIIIEKISCGSDHNLLLSHEGEIYVFGDNSIGQLGTGDKMTQITPKKLNINEKFTDISSHYNYNISIALSVNGLYYIWGECGEEVLTEPKETQFKSFEDVFEYYLKINYRAIEKRVIAFNYRFITNGKYEKDFEEIKELGKGSYGQVFKVKNRNRYGIEEELFAIKKIKFETKYEREFLNELETSPIVHELDNENIMKYYDLWLENDSNNYILYIQMELCDKPLNEIIEEMKNDSNLFDPNNFKKMLTELGYYIASEIFVQILNGVNYLHKQNSKPIIHRDLKPDNIMLKIGNKKNKIIVKISDLGLAKLHDLDIKHTADRGHIKYMAPEVGKGEAYDTRADIYSLGKVLEEMFYINVNRDYQNDSNISTKYNKLNELCIKMNQQRVLDRYQSIEQILGEKYLWVLSAQEFSPKNELERVLNSNQNNNSYVYKLIEHLC